MSNRRQAASGGSAPPHPGRGRSTALVAAIVLACLAVPVVIGLVLRSGDGSSGGGSTGRVPNRIADVECIDPPDPASDPPSFDRPPDPSEARGAIWRAVLHTTCGDIVLELDGERAPQAVASFLLLAREDYWADSPCLRLTTARIFVLQCGDPTGTGGGGPGYTFGTENAPQDGRYPTGTVAMARGSDPNSNGSQFFLVYDDTSLPIEGGGYTIFGRVVRGMAVVEAVARQGVSGGGVDGPPALPISLLSVSVEQQ